MKEKKKMQDYINFANHKGITLLVLVITIIVMMILAGVTIAISMNDDGIINKTISALAKLEVSEEKDTLAVAHSALLMREELYENEITAKRLEDKINESGRKANVYDDEDEEGILIVQFKKTGNKYRVRIENGAIEFKGTGHNKNDKIEICSEDIIFTIDPDDWTNKDVTTTITVDNKVNMSDFVLQWTKTPKDGRSWQNYEERTKITSDKKETIYARIRDKDVNRTITNNEKNIEKIDKKAPTGTLAVESITTNNATVRVTANDEATEEYGASGIKGYYYSKDDGATWSDLTTDTTYQFTKLTQTNEYKFKVKIEDKVGNTDVFGTDGTTEPVPTPTEADLKHSITWTGTNATVTFTTTAGFWIQTSTNGTNWVDTNPVTVPSGTTIYVRYSDSEDITEEGSNKGPQYAAVRPLWTGTVTYNANGGTGGPSAQKVEHTKTAIVNFTNKPTKTGYTFAGWYTQANGIGILYTESGIKEFTMGTTDVTLHAEWTANTYTVTYNGNGNTDGSTVNSSHTYDENKTLTTNGYTRTGYTFAGWNTKADGTGTSYTNGQTVKNLSATAGATVTLYAKWTANTYTVTYNGNGNTGGSTANSTHTYDANKTLTTNGYTKTGYTFAGWNTKADGTGTSYTNGQSVKNLTTTAGGTVTLYAKWTANTYNLTINMNGGLCYWKVNGTKHSGETKTITFTYGTSQRFADTCYTDDESGYGERFVQIDHTAINGERIPKRDGYTFTGFTVTSGSGTVRKVRGGPVYGYYYDTYYYDASYAGNVTITAQWTANTYTVTYNGNGNTGGSTANSTHTYNANKTLTTNGYTKTGYSFAGWNTNADGTGTSYTNGQSVKNLTTTAGGTVTLYAKWTANTYKIYFSANGGTGAPSAITRTYGQAVTFPTTVPTKTGYTFQGWLYYSTGNNSSTATSTATSGSYKAGATAQPSSGNICYTANDTTYVATWSANKYKTTVDPNGGTFKYGLNTTATNRTTAINGSFIYGDPTARVSGTTTTSYDASSSGIPSLPWRTGYTFDGWEVINGAKGSVTIKDGWYRYSAENAGDVTIRAKWKANEYTLTINPNGASMYGTLANGTVGWTDQSVTRKFTYDSSYVFAHTGVYAADGMMYVPSEGTPKTYSRSGYVFLGWKITSGGGVLSTSVAGDGATYWIFNGKYAGNVTITAQWSANTYTVTYNGNGKTGGSTADSSHTYGTEKALTANGYTKTGCAFAGWNTKADGTGTAYTDKKSVKNLTTTAGGTITLYAQWTDVAGPTISVSKAVASDKYSATLTVSANDLGSGVKSLMYAPGNQTSHYMSEHGTKVSGTISVKLNARYFLDAHNTTTLKGKDLTECSYTFYAIDNAGFSTTYNYKLTDLLLEVYFTGRNGLEVTNGGGSYGGSINSSNGVITIDDKISGSTQHGPYVTLPAGTYDVAWWGDGWTDVGFDISTSTTTGSMTKLKDGSNTYSNYFAFSGWRISNKTSRIELRCRGKKTKGSGTTTVEKILLKQTSK